MNFLEKLDYMMEKYGLNMRTLSIKSDIPYTTINTWYKSGYENLRLPTLRKLSNFFNTSLDFWIIDEITDPNYGKSNAFQLTREETELIEAYRCLSDFGKGQVSGFIAGVAASEKESPSATA